MTLNKMVMHRLGEELGLVGPIADLANIPSAVNFQNSFHFSADSNLGRKLLDTKLPIKFEDPA